MPRWKYRRSRRSHALVTTLAEGVKQADADLYDVQFADDVLWGNPYGGTLSGYADLNGAHRSIMAAGGAPPSRFEIVQWLTPTDGVIIAHVRRHDLSDDSGTGSLRRRFTSSSNSAANGGWPPDRTPPSPPDDRCRLGWASPAQITSGLRPTVTVMVDGLKRWLSPTATTQPQRDPA